MSFGWMLKEPDSIFSHFSFFNLLETLVSEKRIYFHNPNLNVLLKNTN